MEKETLLRCNWFINNEYLDQYLIFVNLRKQNTESTAFERHHIIPVCYYNLKFKTYHYYKGKTLANNDIDQEIVWLSREDHIKAHELLVKCTRGELHEKLASAVKFMHEPKTTSTQYTNFIPHVLRCWICNFSTNTQQRVPKSELSTYLAKGWKKGTLRRYKNRNLVE